jgi:hypothetical protein
VPDDLRPQVEQRVGFAVPVRGEVQQGRWAIPKSTRPERIAEKVDIVDFELADEQLTAIDGLDTGRRDSPEPATITLANFGRPIPRTDATAARPRAPAAEHSRQRRCMVVRWS